MSEKDLNLLIELVQEKLRKGISKEDAMNSFMAAGIMDAKGLTEPYKEIEDLVP